MTSNNGVQQVSMDEVRTFDGDAKNLLAGYHEAGWASHRTKRGHVIVRSPDGQETATVTRDSLRGRSGRNAAAPLKRWKRDQEPVKGAAFGITDLDEAQALGRGMTPEGAMPARLLRVLEGRPKVLEYVEQHFGQGHDMYSRYELGAPDADRTWGVVDVTAWPFVVVDHGEAITAEQLLAEALAHHPVQENEGNTMATLLKCLEPGCGFTTAHPGAFSLHSKIRHTGFVCPECGLNTGHAGKDLAHHRRDVHGVAMTYKQKTSSGAPVCRWCGKEFTTTSGRGGHESRRHKGEPMPEVPPSLDVTGDVPVTSPEPEPALVPEPEPVTDQDVPVTSPASTVVQVLSQLPTGADAVEMIAAIRAVVTPPLVAELEQLRTHRDELLHTLDQVTKERDELSARMEIMREAMGL